MKKTALCKRLLALFVCVFAFVGASAQVSGNTLTITKDNVTKNLSDFGDLSNVTTIKLVGDFPYGWNSGILPGSAAWKSQITSIDLSAANFSATTETVTGERPSTQHSISNSWTFEGFTNSNLTITWPTNSSITVLPEKAFYGCGMQSVTIPSSVVTIGKFAFGTCGNLKSVTFTNPTNVQYLLESCFKETGLTSVSIPGTVMEIQTMAFQSTAGTSPLESIVFENSNGDPVDMMIAKDAFNNDYNILDVYVEVTNGEIHAAVDAFPKDVTYGQTDPDHPRATLHYPKEKIALYSNLDHKLTPADIKTQGAFQTWLNAHNTEAGKASNGFFQFVDSGPVPDNSEFTTSDVVLKTFSDATVDYLVPKGSKAFIVTDVSSEDNGVTFKLNLVKVNVIPHGTGVILYGGMNTPSPDNHNMKAFSMTAVDYTGSPFTRTHTLDVTENGEDISYKNLLVPTANSSNAKVSVTPFELDSQGKVEWRNFGLGWYSNTETGNKHPSNDFIGFFRLKAGNMKPGKAYLRLRASDEYTKYNGGEIIIPQDVASNLATYGPFDYRLEYHPSTGAVLSESDMQSRLYWYTNSDPAHANDSKILWKNDWGTRNLGASFAMEYNGEPFFEFDDLEGVATMIVPASMVDIETTDSYYTLQGIKVNNPSKGVYIKNGKKVIIK